MQLSKLKSFISLSLSFISGSLELGHEKIYMCTTFSSTQRIFFKQMKKKIYRCHPRINIASCCERQFLSDGSSWRPAGVSKVFTHLRCRDLPINHCNSACPAPSRVIRVRICISDYTGREGGNGLPVYRSIWTCARARARRSYA